MKVYVVLHGEICEGSSVVSVHKRLKPAIEAALAVKPSFPGGWKPDGKYEWANECDFVSVKQYKVKE